MWPDYIKVSKGSSAKVSFQQFLQKHDQNIHSLTQLHS